MANKINGVVRRDRTIVEQANSIRVKYPEFTVTFDRESLRAVGVLQPTPRSILYTIEIRYQHQALPKVSVLDPALIKNFKGDDIPHVYPGKKLCLFYPKYREFRYADYIGDTIIPWTSLWLYYYEDWHVSGDWHGEGIQH